MSKDTLLGKTATFFMIGGWEITGVVISKESDKIILDVDSELHILFKDKVSIVKIVNRLDDKKDSKPLADRRDEAPHNQNFPENGISYSETFLNIPRSLLGNSSKENDNEFSVSFEEKATNKSISFQVEDEYWE